MLRWKNNQGIGFIDIHALPMVGSAMAVKSTETRENQEIADKPGKIYGGVKNSRLPDNRMVTDELS